MPTKANDFSYSESSNLFYHIHNVNLKQQVDHIPKFFSKNNKIYSIEYDATFCHSTENSMDQLWLFYDEKYHLYRVIHSVYGKWVVFSVQCSDAMAKPIYTLRKKINAKYWNTWIRFIRAETKLGFSIYAHLIATKTQSRKY